MEPVGGEPLLRRQTQAAVQSGCPVMVCLPVTHGPRHQAVEGLNVTSITVHDAAEGIGATLRTAALFAARHAPDRNLMILLPDVPGIGPFDIKSVITAFEDAGSDTPTRASDADNRPGTPLIVPTRLVPAFTELTGDDGGKSILRNEPVKLVQISDNRAITDLDTPEDWARWREEHNAPD